MKKYIVIILPLILIIFTGFSFAGYNSGNVGQYGNNNKSIIYQEGSLNQAYNLQLGNGNYASISQRGNNNLAFIKQGGSIPAGFYGVNVSCIFQQGDDSEAFQYQEGFLNYAWAYKIGFHDTLNLLNQIQRGKENKLLSSQYGLNNLSVRCQKGSYNFLNTCQNGKHIKVYTYQYGQYNNTLKQDRIKDINYSDENHIPIDINISSGKKFKNDIFNWLCKCVLKDKLRAGRYLIGDYIINIAIVEDTILLQNTNIKTGNIETRKIPFYDYDSVRLIC